MMQQITPIFSFNSGLQVQQDTPPLVVWKMKAPEKKPLVRREAPDEVRAKVRKCKSILLSFSSFQKLQKPLQVRRGSQKRASNPMKVLSEFHGPEEESGDNL